MAKQVSYLVHPVTLRERILIEQVSHGDLAATAALLKARTDLSWDEVYDLQDGEITLLCSGVKAAIGRSSLLVANIRYTT